MCEKTAPQLTAPADLMLRQVYPKWLEEDGEPSSQAFYPWRTIDDGCLSVDQRALTTPERAHQLFTAPPPDGFGQPSAGVWGLTVEEVGAVGVTTWADPVAATPEKPANPAHALFEFADRPKKDWKSIGRILKLKARTRGKLHPVAG